MLQQGGALTGRGEAFVACGGDEGVRPRLSQFPRAQFDRRPPLGFGCC